MPSILDVPEVLHVVPIGGGGGVTPSSRYAETLWLPIIGPTCLWLGRRLETRGALGPFDVEVTHLAAELGVRGVGRRSPMRRSLLRLAEFGLADLRGDVYLTRLRWPYLTERQLQHVPENLRALHPDRLTA